MKIAANAPEQLQTSVATYRIFWGSLNFSGVDWDPGETKFDGGVADLEALAFCEYEVGFPEEDLSLASLIWGQVMVVSGEATWLDLIDGQIAIGGPGSNYPPVVFFPYSRLTEIRLGTFQTYDWFATLTDLFLLQAFHAGYEAEDLPELCEISARQEYWTGASEMDRLAEPLQTLRSLRNSQPDGAANGSQPIRSETNSSPSATGSRR